MAAPVFSLGAAQSPMAFAVSALVILPQSCYIRLKRRANPLPGALFVTRRQKQAANGKR
ncbi:hypothetical protein [Novosphingobium pokkalii]|uniref:Uncharacterized protein n=2 Tax=Novosphingobium pokkalii TaxID=1770194 RepID=A0ABV7V1A1_9SPHN|nr:hypothetical protein [Novosphingobium pokkalii]